MKINNETLFNAIGALGDEDIAFAENFLKEKTSANSSGTNIITVTSEMAATKPSVARRLRPFSMQFAVIAAACLLLVVGTVAMFHVFSPDDLPPVVDGTTTPATSQNAPPQQTTEEPPVKFPPVTPSELWIIPPELEYERVMYCGCGKFRGYIHGDERDILDPKTGLQTGDIHREHGRGAYVPWIYDPNLNLFGHDVQSYSGLGLSLYSADEFLLKFEQLNNTVNLFLKVDSTKQYTDEWGNTLLLDGAYSEFWGAAHGTKLITGSVYTAGGSGVRNQDVISVVDAVDGVDKHGIICKNGEVIVPFWYDNIVVIDNKSAFVLFEGKWGILAIDSSVAPENYPVPRFISLPAPNRSPIFLDVGDKLTDKWTLVKNSNESINLVDSHGNKFMNMDFQSVMRNMRNVSDQQGGIHGDIEMSVWHQFGSESYWFDIEDGELVFKARILYHFIHSNWMHVYTYDLDTSDEMIDRATMLVTALFEESGSLFTDISAIMMLDNHNAIISASFDRGETWDEFSVFYTLEENDVMNIHRVKESGIL
jgi:hypothetical protein